MKKHLAIMLVAIVALSVLGAAEVAAAPANNQGPVTSQSLTPITSQPFVPAPDVSPNQAPTNPPGPGAVVGVQIQGPKFIVPNSNQVILVTVLYNKRNFDPLEYGGQSYWFGPAGAQPFAYSIGDVNHDGYKDLTLAFYAKDTGLTPSFATWAKLSGTISIPGGCRPTVCLAKDSITKLGPISTKRVCIAEPICLQYVALPIVVQGSALVSVMYQ